MYTILSFHSTGFLQEPEILKNIQSKPYEELPKILRYSNETFSNPMEVTKRLIDFYLNGTGFTAKNVNSFGLMISDAVINFGMAKLTRQIRNSQDIFTYRFDYEGTFTAAKKNNKNPVALAHTDELQYLFTNEMTPKYTKDDKEYEIVDFMVTSWYQFAKFG